MSGRQTLTIWSPYTNQDVEILIKNYHAVHPDVDVIHTTHGLINYFSFLRTRMAQGLGPDLAIVSDEELASVIELSLVEDLEKYDLNLSDFNSRAIESLRAEDNHLYGVPFAFQTMALCYNRAQVTEPPATLKAVLEQTYRGQGIAIDSGFLSSIWGVMFQMCCLRLNEQTKFQTVNQQSNHHVMHQY